MDTCVTLSHSPTTCYTREDNYEYILYIVKQCSTIQYSVHHCQAIPCSILHCIRVQCPAFSAMKLAYCTACNLTETCHATEISTQELTYLLTVHTNTQTHKATALNEGQINCQGPYSLYTTKLFAIENFIISIDSLQNQTMNIWHLANHSIIINFLKSVHYIAAYYNSD